MKAMIFAAGLGTRLKPWTDFHPKALAEVGGWPVLDYALQNVAAAGATEAVVNVHHFAEQVERHLASRTWPLEVKVSDERALLLDTGGGLLHALPLLGAHETVLLHNADIFTRGLDLRAMAEAHLSSGADATLLCSHRTSSRQLAFEGTRLSGWINHKDGKTLGRVDGESKPLSFNGIHIVGPRVLDALRRYRSDGEVFPIIPFYLSVCATLNLQSYLPSDAYQWHDVGRPESLAAANASV